LQAWGDVAVAMAELALARVGIGRVNSQLDQLLVHGTPKTVEPSLESLRQGERIGRALGRAAELVPWRTDCVVKALAACHWLGRLGIAATIELGVRRDPTFAAHAWVRIGRHIVIGGTTTDYAPFRRWD
jgi:hypothetical protein